MCKSIDDDDEVLRLTKVFAKAGLDNVTSAMYKLSSGSGSTFNLQLLFLTSTSVFQLGICTGLDNQ